jgi:hypothetical protein
VTGAAEGGVRRRGVEFCIGAVEAGERRDAVVPVEGAAVERGGGRGGRGRVEEVGAAVAARLARGLVGEEVQAAELAVRRERGLHLRVRRPPG